LVMPGTASKPGNRPKVELRAPRLITSKAGSVEYREGRVAAGCVAAGLKPQVS